MDNEITLHMIGFSRKNAESLTQYLFKHKKPDIFIEAILCNDLKEACRLAEDEEKYTIYDIVYFLWNYVPRNAWGTKANYEAWTTK